MEEIQIKYDPKFPLVSICIPVYNAEKWLNETLYSAINQTYRNIEIIIVDDGSSDRSWKIIENYRERYPNIIKTHKQENKGACAARNKALELSKGDYIQWLDADDILANEKIEKQLSAIDFIKKTDVLLSSSFAKFYINSRKSKLISNKLWQDLIPKYWLLTYLLDPKSIMYPHCWLVSRENSIKAGLWREDILLNQDGEYFSRVVLNSSMVKFVPEAICYYRTGNLGSVSNKKSKKKIVSLIEANISIVQNVLEKFNDDETRSACLFFLKRFYSSILYSDEEIIEIKKLTNYIKSLGGELPPKEESRKFAIVKKILGLKRARELKLFLWNLEVKIRKTLDALTNF